MPPKLDQKETTQSSESKDLSDIQIPAAYLDLLQTWRKELMASIDQRILETSQKTIPSAPPHVTLHPVAETYIPTGQLIHPGQMTQQPLYRF